MQRDQGQGPGRQRGSGMRPILLLIAIGAVACTAESVVLLDRGFDRLHAVGLACGIVIMCAGVYEFLRRP